MASVQIWSVISGAVSAAGWAAGAAYLVASTALVVIALVRSGAPRFGPANAVTAARSLLIAGVTALVVTSFSQAVPPLLLVAVAGPALALDAVDGWIARRTRTESAVGARYDMETDAYLLLVLSAADVPLVGGWVLAIGLMRYAFVAAGWLLPWMRAPLPFRYWRKVVAAACGVALLLVASRLLPTPIDALVGAVALGLLVESFGRDVVWLVRLNSSRRALVYSP